MPIALDQFAQQLVDVGLMSAGEMASLRAASTATDAEQFARELVKQKRLTAFQAQQAYAGKAKGLVLGNYVVLDKLGQGGMGMVLKAEHRRMKRVVALKILSPSVTKTPELVARFHREVQAAARLEHPNIVSSYDADEAHGTHFFVMQYVDGQDLASLVKKKGTLAVEQAVSCILQTARGLQFAHAQGVIHRDIKPANLLLDGQGVVKILDMGLARIEGDTGSQAEITQTGAVMGTVDYMAPEQARNTKAADARSDIYSLGISLWYLLTGKPAYDGTTLTERLLAHQTDPIPSLRAARPEIPAALDDVFQRMVEKRPADRYQTMTDVIAALEGCLRGGTATTPSLASAASEDSQFNAFLAGLAQTDAGPQTAGGRKSAAATAVAPSDVFGATQPVSQSDSRTDPQTVASLARESKSRTATATWWQDRRVQIGGGAAAVLVALSLLIPWGPRDATPPVAAPTPPPTTAALPAGAEYALEFDGNAYVNIPTLKFTGEPITLEAWIQPGLLSSGCYLNTSAPGSAASLWGGMGINGFTTITPAGTRVGRQMERLQTGRWYHVAGVFDGDTASYFVDGRLISQSASFSEPEPAILQGTWIGGIPDYEMWRGRIREARVSKSARYTAVFTPPRAFEKDDRTLALYRFDEGRGTTLNDRSGNGHHGTIVKAAWVTDETDRASAATMDQPLASQSAISPTGPDYALQFDGQSSYVDLSTLSGFLTEPHTIEAYVTPARIGKDDTRYQLVICLGGHNGSSLAQYHGHWTTTFNQLQNNFSHEAAEGTVVVDQCVHVAAVWDGREATLFVEGLKSPLERQVTDKSQGQLAGLLGAAGLMPDGRLNHPFAGLIDEVRISKVVRYTQDFEPQPRFAADADTVALYHCDEGQGEVLRDSSGNNHHGRIMGAIWVNARTGHPVAPSTTKNYALEFDGKSHVQLPALDLVSTGSVTFEVTAWPQRPAIVMKDDFAASILSCKEGLGFGLVAKDRGLSFEMGTAKAEAFAFHNAWELGSPWDGRRRRIAAVVDGERQMFRLFVDGRLARELPYEGAIHPGPHPLLLGADPNAQGQPGNWFTGRLDEVRISRVARYAADYVPADRLESDAETLVLYHCDEGKGDVLKDSSGNNRHGKIVNATWVDLRGGTPVADGPAHANSDAVSPTTVSYELSFDGQDDLVEFAPLPAGTMIGTIEAWVTPTALNQGEYGTRVVKLGPFELYANSPKQEGNWIFSIAVPDAFNLAMGASDVRPIIGQRTHLAAVMGPTHVMLFVNGRSVGRPSWKDRKAALETLLNQSELPMVVGALRPDGRFRQHWQGRMDELRISRTPRYDADFVPADRFSEDSDTIALYHFDEGQGDVLKDSSGNNRHGKIVGATWVSDSAAPAVATQAAADYELDLTPHNGTPSHVQIPHHVRLDENLTIELFATSADIPPPGINRGLFSGGGSTALKQYGASWGWHVKTGNPSMSNLEYAAHRPVAAGRRVHLAGVSTPTEIRLYVDGKLAQRRPISAPYLHRSHPVTLGQVNSSTGWDSFHGTIDELRISTVARYDADFTPPKRFETDSNTWGLYHCDEGEGDRLVDSSGNNRHGQIVGAKWVRGREQESPSNAASGMVEHDLLAPQNIDRYIRMNHGTARHPQGLLLDGPLRHSIGTSDIPRPGLNNSQLHAQIELLEGLTEQGNIGFGYLYSERGSIKATYIAIPGQAPRWEIRDVEDYRVPGAWKTLAQAPADIDPKQFNLDVQLSDGTMTVLANGQETLRAQVPDREYVAVGISARSSKWLVRKWTLTELQANSEIDLLKSLDLKRDVVSGDWELRGESLLTPLQKPQAPQNRIQWSVPKPVPDEYDIELDIEREAAGGTGLSFGFVMGGRQGVVNMDSYSTPKLWALQDIDGKSGRDNPTRNPGERLPVGERKHAVIQVRRGQVKVLLDGDTIIDWHGKPEQLSTTFWTVPDKQALFVGSQSRMLIHRAVVKPR